MEKNILRGRLTVTAIIFAIAAISLLVLGVMPKWDAVKSKKAGIKNEMETLNIIERTGINNPTNPKIQAWMNYKNELEKEYAKCLEYYKKSGKGINRLFEDVKIEGNGEINEESFINAYNTAREKMIFEPLETMKISIVNEKGIEVTRKEEQSEILSCEVPLNKNEFKITQKFFWVTQKLIGSIAAPELGVKKCGPVIFDKVITDNIKDPLGNRAKFEITVYLPFKSIDRLVYNILKFSDGEPVIDIKKVKIERSAKQQEEIKEQVLLMEQKGKWNFTQDEPYVKVKIEGLFFMFE